MRGITAIILVNILTSGRGEQILLGPIFQDQAPVMTQSRQESIDLTPVLSGVKALQTRLPEILRLSETSLPLRKKFNLKFAGKMNLYSAAVITGKPTEVMKECVNMGGVLPRPISVSEYQKALEVAREITKTPEKKSMLVSLTTVDGLVAYRGGAVVLDEHEIPSGTSTEKYLTDFQMAQYEVTATGKELALQTVDKSSQTKEVVEKEI